MITQHNGNVFLRFYVNSCNCNKFCLGTCFSRLQTCDYTATVYLAQRSCLQPILPGYLVPKLSQNECLGKGSDGTLKTLRHSFYLFSAASWEVYSSVQFSAQSCRTLCDPMDCSMPGLPVHHQLRRLLKLKSIEKYIGLLKLVRWVLSYPLLMFM